MQTHADLWNRLQHFSFDRPGVSLTFAARLAQDNGWTLPYATRVVEEYRRFLFLAVAAGHPVTPSDQVDQAWHLHLAYTRSYWDDLCARTLGRPLHHGPTEGGDEESAKFHGWYQRTLDSYRRLFGHAPPTDVWPHARVRFGERFVRVRLAPPRRRNPLLAPAAAASVAGIALAAGCTQDLTTEQWWIGVGLVLIVAFVVMLFVKLARASGPGSGGGCGSIGSGCGSSDGGGGCGGGGCGGGGD